jgi:outer membrane scaffolding protein for murein synthesis (MipA/OmpV family)
MLRGFTGYAAPGALALALVFAGPAFAQDAPAIKPERDVFDGDYVIIGGGALALPTYEGSDSTKVVPAFGASGEISGISFTIRGPSLSVDLLPDRPGSDVGFRFGPQIRYRANRNGSVGDPVVARLGKLDAVVEAGFRAGVSVEDLISREDRLNFGVSARWDISGNGSGMIVTPSATYLLPVSRGHAFGALVSAQFMDGDYADYNFGITPAGAAASGLPAFDAKGGFKEISIALATARDFNNNFLDGGFAIGVGAMYSRMFGSAARSPITSIRGSRNQWTFGGGLAYTF